MSDTILEHIKNLEDEISDIKTKINSLTESFQEIIGIMGNLEHKLNLLEVDTPKKTNKARKEKAEIEVPVPRGRKFPETFKDWLKEVFETNNKKIINMIPEDVYRTAEKKVMNSKPYKSAEDKEEVKVRGLVAWFTSKNEEIKDLLEKQYEKEKEEYNT